MPSSRAPSLFVVAALATGSLTIAGACTTEPGQESDTALMAEASSTTPTASSSEALDEWKTSLARETNVVWITSNEDYMEEDGGTEAYGMELRLLPDGMTASGCMWGESQAGGEQVFWRFFQGWDPARGAGFIYQSHPQGLVAFGYLEDRGPYEPELTQHLMSPDGTITRNGHFETWDGERRVSRSVNWIDGAWAPGRSYTWDADSNRVSPC